MLNPSDKYVIRKIAAAPFYPSKWMTDITDKYLHNTFGYGQDMLNKLPNYATAYPNRIKKLNHWNHKPLEVNKFDYGPQNLTWWQWAGLAAMAGLGAKQAYNIISKPRTPIRYLDYFGTY